MARDISYKHLIWKTRLDQVWNEFVAKFCVLPPEARDKFYAVFGPELRSISAVIQVNGVDGKTCGITVELLEKMIDTLAKAEAKLLEPKGSTEERTHRHYDLIENCDAGGTEAKCECGWRSLTYGLPDTCIAEWHRHSNSHAILGSHA